MDSTDVTPEVILWFVGIAILIASYKIPQLKELRISQNRFQTERDYNSNPYTKFNTKQLDSVVTRMSTSYTVLLAIFGILIAFVVSGPIFESLFSWYFIIWIGWVLAIIVKAGILAVSLFDINEINMPQANRIRTLYEAKQFFKYSWLLLIITIAFLPTFSLLDTDFVSKENLLETNPSVIILSIATGVGATFSMFYFILFRRYMFANSGGVLIIFLIGTMIMAMASIFVHLQVSSPIERITITLFDLGHVTITNVFYGILRFGIIFLALAFGTIYALYRHQDFI